MKALFISPAGAAYGSERSMLALLGGQQFEAEVVCPGGGALQGELQRLEIPVHPLEFGKYSLRQNPVWHLGFFYRLRQILKAIRPDVMVINLDGNTPLITLAAVCAGIPMVRFSRFEFTPPTRWLDRWCWLKAQAVICPSELVKQQVLAWAPPEFHSRVHRFYESNVWREVSTDEIAKCREELHLGDDRVIGLVGRLHRGKRVEVAIQAFADVQKAHEHVRLLVVGDHDGSPSGTAYEIELRELARDLEVKESVIFVGYCQAERVPAVLAACQVCILPSESESFGMVLMEAWAQGVPTVASDIGGCREITLAAGAGFLVPVGEVAKFSKYVSILLESPEEAKRMGENGREWVIQNCSASEYSNQFKVILENVVSNPL
jgi:glycosyltransferase involved in cell wall biosynthesis